MRLDKFIAQTTDLTRRTAQYAIRDGRILVNGNSKVKATQKITDACEITYDGQVLSIPALVYLMLNKPQGVVSTHSDATHTTLLDLLQEAYPQELQIAGRLDVETTGLILITDDGLWNHKVTSPKRSTGKRYRVSVVDPIDESVIETFAEGIVLRGEKRATKPAKLKIINTHEALLTITEGKYHQVKRMFAAVGNKVTALHREAVGSIELDAALAPGEYRALTPQEVASI